MATARKKSAPRAQKSAPRVKKSALGGKKAGDEEVVFFASTAALRAWLGEHGETASELWIGIHHNGKGKGPTYSEVVDEVLCFGWIDGIRKRLDEVSFKTRLTPRKTKSKWSDVNVARAERLAAAGRMAARGMAAFDKRAEVETRYSFEKGAKQGLGPERAAKLRANARAWAFFSARPPGYQRTSGFWVESAKREETRERRLAALMACCEKGELLPSLVRPEPVKKG